MAMLNEAKYRNAILYFAHHVRQLGRTKLWKLLYYLDFDHFERYGTSVTGEEYWKWDNGPVPSSGLAMVHRMEANGDIVVTPESTGMQNPLLRVCPERGYDKDVFSASEWETLKAVARKWKFHSARDMSHATHGEPPWQQTERNAVIRYDLALQRGNDDGGESDLTLVSTEGADMDAVAQLALARERSLAYAKRTEQLWDSDPVVRTRIQRGIDQLRSGQCIPVNIDDLLNQRRDKPNPS